MPDVAAKPARSPGHIAARVERRPRLWGCLFAGLLLAAYLVAVRPARLWTAEHVALPLLEALDTERARGFGLAQPAARPDAVFALPRGSGVTAEAAALGATLEDGAPVPNWSAPVGVLFLLPAMFLLVAFPTRPFWLLLLGYHVAIGLVAFAVFAIGLAVFEPAFGLYVFTRTYVTETVSLVVPLLLALAGGRTGLGARASG